jgi:hypothetical protein
MTKKVAKGTGKTGRGGAGQGGIGPGGHGKGPAKRVQKPAAKKAAV